MIFDNCRRRISEITDAELKDLIGNQEENQWIEFKRQDYPTDPNDSEKRRNEICKDVTAMANAEGGYIFIGVQEKSGRAQDFCTIDKPDSIAQSINDICLQYITPRIQNLEVKQRSFEWNGEEINLVIIHIPPSGLRRHGFVCKNSTHFVKRYEDNIRYYPMSELVEAFRGTRERRSPISPEENALEQEDVRDLLHLMKLRFEDFQWGKENRGIPADLKWLFPYPVCEYPVTFMMLVKAIYSAAGIDSEILVQQEYRNLSGFLLVGDHPANPWFGEGDRFQRVYTEPHAIGEQQTIEPEFIPDRVAYGLIKEIYTSFGLREDLIPFFDADLNFVPLPPTRM